MVKRLHLRQAAEVLAASLAVDGFTGPRSVLEGEAGKEPSQTEKRLPKLVSKCSGQSEWWTRCTRANLMPARSKVDIHLMRALAALR
jgi:hypothetical protein